MNSPKITNRQLVELAKTYWQWRWVWASTTAAFALLGLFYVLFLKSDIWVASQAIIVRDEANGAVMRLGRFQSQTEMKAAQETVLEMARNTQVLHDALVEVGREPTWFGVIHKTEPPTASEIEDLANSGIEVRAPRGAEFGTTEVIYLDVKDTSKERAVKLNNAVCTALEEQLRSVRQSRASGVVAELTTARDGAATALQAATERLQAFEAEVGADLSDLRGLTDANAGGTANRLVLDAIRVEMRQVELQRHQLETDSNLAKESFENPDHLLLTPSRLVSNHAGLRKLREGLADAKIQTAQLAGRFTEKNPIVIAALETEDRIRAQLREELGIAMQSLTKDVEVAEQQIAKLQSQQSQLESRLSRLAEIRAVYANVASEVRARNQELQDTERELGQATASRDAAFTSSLVTRLDAAMIGERPIGPGRSTILAGTVFGGLFFGLGIVFLLTPLDSHLNFGRRRFDYSNGRGRRDQDEAELAITSGAEPLATNLTRDGEVEAATFPLKTQWSEISARSPTPEPSDIQETDDSARVPIKHESKVAEEPVSKTIEDPVSAVHDGVSPSGPQALASDDIQTNVKDAEPVDRAVGTDLQGSNAPPAAPAEDRQKVGLSSHEGNQRDGEHQNRVLGDAKPAVNDSVASGEKEAIEPKADTTSHEAAQAIIMEALKYSSGVSITTSSVR